MKLCYLCGKSIATGAICKDCQKAKAELNRQDHQRAMEKRYAPEMFEALKAISWLAWNNEGELTTDAIKKVDELIKKVEVNK